MTDIEGFLTIYGHSDSRLNNKSGYQSCVNHFCNLKVAIQIRLLGM